MRIDFVSLFPEMVRPCLEHSMMRRAAASGIVKFGFANPRDFCYDRHQKVDDSPFGGEPGMLIKPQPVALALESLRPLEGAAVILTAPTGARFVQSHADELSQRPHLIFLCGHYEGFDHRVETQLATHVFSIGDFVLTNGELPAALMTDAVVRLLPGVLGDPQSLESDSFSDGLLSAPNYTRPEVWKGEAVPDVLRSGDHEAVRRWRRAVALEETLKSRPDLLKSARLTKSDLKLLERHLDKNA